MSLITLSSQKVHLITSKRKNGELKSFIKVLHIFKRV